MCAWGFKGGSGSSCFAQPWSNSASTAAQYWPACSCWGRVNSNTTSPLSPSSSHTPSPRQSVSSSVAASCHKAASSAAPPVPPVEPCSPDRCALDVPPVDERSMTSLPSPINAPSVSSWQGALTIRSLSDVALTHPMGRRAMDAGSLGCTSLGGSWVNTTYGSTNSMSLRTDLMFRAMWPSVADALTTSARLPYVLSSGCLLLSISNKNSRHRTMCSLYFVRSLSYPPFADGSHTVIGSPDGFQLAAYDQSSIPPSTA
mmetsp:Transcript_32950/g.95093  ORF Transcript_32950/g.95093 Transcript_32950/m.95093 type:complete len:258 (-) Transcript_32950:251-1024(-)